MSRSARRSSGPCATRCRKVSPWSSSMTMNAAAIGRLADVVDRADVGVLQAATACASRLNRSRARVESVECAASTLMATSLASRSSRAL